MSCTSSTRRGVHQFERLTGGRTVQCHLHVGHQGGLGRVVVEPAAWNAVRIARGRGAGVDLELAAYYRAILESIRANWGFVYDHDLDDGWVRTDRRRQQVVEVWCMAASPETHLRFTRVYGWTDDQDIPGLVSACRDIWSVPPPPGGAPTASSMEVKTWKPPGR